MDLLITISPQLSTIALENVFKERVYVEESILMQYIDGEEKKIVDVIEIIAKLK